MKSKVLSTIFYFLVFAIFYYAFFKGADKLLHIYPGLIDKIVKEYPASKDAAKMAAIGQFGDLFGSLNAILSFASIFLLAISIIYQVVANKDQHRAQKKSDVESNFFNS